MSRNKKILIFTFGGLLLISLLIFGQNCGSDSAYIRGIDEPTFQQQTILLNEIEPRPRVIEAFPTSNLLVGNNLTLSYLGDGEIVEWFKNGELFLSDSRKSLEFVEVNEFDAGTYFVRVDGTKFSDPIEILVQ